MEIMRKKIRDLAKQQKKRVYSQGEGRQVMEQLCLIQKLDPLLPQSWKRNGKREGIYNKARQTFWLHLLVHYAQGCVY